VSQACNFEGCAVGETGICALERDPTACEHRRGLRERDADPEIGAPPLANAAGDLAAPVLKTREETASFPSSRTLGLEVVSRMMASRYVTVVGILGDPESGKTACLVSLYLLVANAKLNGWTFADSRSLMAFEEIARGARDWNQGKPPDQMTVHTEMSDDRRPGFLHLRLVRSADRRCIDLALPDLPGEWTTDLVSVNRADRFEFMKSAEVVWMVADGRSLADKERRQGAISRLGQLAGRLRSMFDEIVPRLLVVVTHRDHGEVDQSASELLKGEFAKRDLSAEILQVAPFTDGGSIPAGFGMVDLIDATVAGPRPSCRFWRSSPAQPAERAYLGFKRDQ